MPSKNTKSKMEDTSKHYRVSRWKADLDTDLREFCYKENLLPRKRGKGLLNNVGERFNEIYKSGKAKTLGDLIRIPKHEYLRSSRLTSVTYGNRKKRDLFWKTTNKVLNKHGMRIYVKPVTLERL